MSLEPGHRLGPYEIVSPLGAGGMGEVYRARDPRLERDVAIKVLPEHFLEDADSLSRFQSEAKAIASLSHPNIVAIHDTGQEGKRLYVVTELLEGETMRSRLRQGPIGVRKAAEHAARVAEGLAAAHEKGIVHRDIKPENILVTADGRLKLLDFGIARDLSWEKADAASGGTLNFMAPEQLHGRSCLASDVWAIGVIFYALATGCYPLFHQEHPFPAAVDTICTVPEPHEIDGRIPAALERIIMRCLDPALERRYTDAVELREDILRSLPGFGKGLYLPEQDKVEALQT